VENILNQTIQFIEKEFLKKDTLQIDLLDKILGEIVDRNKSIYHSFYFQVCLREKTVKFKDICPKEIYTSDIKQLLQSSNSLHFISELQENPDYELPAKCGFFNIIIQNYLKNISETENSDLWIQYDTKQNTVYPDSLSANSHLNIVPKNSNFDREFLFPVFINNGQNKLLKAIVVLFIKSAHESIKEYDGILRKLSKYFSFYLTLKESKHVQETVLNLISECYSGNINEIKSIDANYETLFNALKLFASDQNIESNSHLKYASYWTVLWKDDEKMTLKSDIILEKEKAYNFQGRFPYIKPHRIISDTSEFAKKHYFLEYSRALLERINAPSGFNYNELIERKKLGELKEKFFYYQKFTDDNRLNDNDNVVLFPIYLAESNDGLTKVYKHKNEEKLKYLGFLALFFDQFAFDEYYSDDVLQTISNKIAEDKCFVIHELRRQIRKNLFQSISKNLLENNSDGYIADVYQIVIDTLNCKECLIFESDDSESQYLALIPPASTDVTVNITLDHEAVHGTPENEMELSDKNIKFSRNFRKFINKVPSHNSYLICTESNDQNQNNIFSYLFIRFSNSNELKKNKIFAIINNQKNIPPNISSSFNRCDFDIALVAAEITSLFFEIQAHDKSKQSLLSNLRHEMPNQTGIIIQESRNLFDLIEEGKVQSAFYEPGLKRHFENIVSHINHSAHTIKSYTEYAIALN